MHAWPEPSSQHGNPFCQRCAAVVRETHVEVLALVLELLAGRPQLGLLLVLAAHAAPPWLLGTRMVRPQSPRLLSRALLPRQASVLHGLEGRQDSGAHALSRAIAAAAPLSRP